MSKVITFLSVYPLDGFSSHATHNYSRWYYEKVYDVARNYPEWVFTKRKYHYYGELSNLLEEEIVDKENNRVLLQYVEEPDSTHMYKLANSSDIIVTVIPLQQNYFYTFVERFYPWSEKMLFLISDCRITREEADRKMKKECRFNPRQFYYIGSFKDCEKIVHILASIG